MHVGIILLHILLTLYIFAVAFNEVDVAQLIFAKKHFIKIALNLLKNTNKHQHRYSRIEGIWMKLPMINCQKTNKIEWNVYLLAMHK